MFCPNCGSQISDGSKFCTNCGSVLGTGDAPGSEAQADPTRVAPRPAPEPQPTVAPAPEPGLSPVPAQQPPRRPGRGKVVAIVVLALLLVAAVAVIVWQVVLPRLGGSQQTGDQTAQEQPAEPETDADSPDADPIDVDPIDLTMPETTTTTQGSTFEDYLNETGMYDMVCDMMTDSLTSSGDGMVTDAGTEVNGNVMEVHIAWNFSSSDANASAMEEAMMAAYSSSDIADQMATAVAQLESGSGVSGVTIELNLYTSDYEMFGSVEYGSAGLVGGSGASFEMGTPGQDVLVS